MHLRKPTLVGRREELSRIEAAMARAMGGHGETVFILGEQYDRETEHHARRAEQLRWQAEVARQLNVLGAYAR